MNFHEAKSTSTNLCKDNAHATYRGNHSVRKVSIGRNLTTSPWHDILVHITAAQDKWEQQLVWGKGTQMAERDAL